MQRCYRFTNIGGYGYGAARLALDINVHQKTLGAGEIIIVAKQSDFVTNAAVSLMADPHSDIDDRRKGDLLEIPAIGLCDQANDRAGFNIEDTAFDQILAHGGIKER